MALDTSYAWYVLNHIPASSLKTDSAKQAVERFNVVAGSDVELFAPTFVEMVERKGKLVRKDVPLVFHYVFVRGRLDDLKRLCGPVKRIFIRA